MLAGTPGLPLATREACGVDSPAFCRGLALVINEADLLGRRNASSLALTRVAMVGMGSVAASWSAAFVFRCILLPLGRLVVVVVVGQHAGRGDGRRSHQTKAPSGKNIHGE